MNISELKTGLNSFMDLADLRLTVYLRLKTGDIKLADITNDILPEMRDLFFEKIKFNITAKEDLCLMNLSEADDRKNVIHEYDFDEGLGIFTDIDSVASNVERANFKFSENSIDDIDGLIIRIARSDASIILYSKCYPINIVKRDKIFKLIPAGTRFAKFDDEILKISGNFEIVRYDSKYFILKYDLLERNYGLEKIIRSTAASSITKIDEIGLVQDIAPLQENLEIFSFARKFAKASKSSPVINLGLSAPIIIDFVKNHSKLADQFKFNAKGDKFILKSKASCKLFIELLNDDYLRSLLTGIDYHTSVKDQMT